MESDEIQQYYDVAIGNESVRLTLRDAIFRKQYRLNSEDFSLRVSAGPRSATVPLPLEHWRAIGALLPLLAGNHSEVEIPGLLREMLTVAEQLWCGDLLATLDSHRFLERKNIRPNSFLVSPSRPRVSLVGHTSILLQTSNPTILTDPVLRVEGGTPAHAFDVTRLNLSAICCTHAHWDHCDVETLLRFDKTTPVIIPRIHRPTIFNPPIVPMLKRLGFQDVREFEPWDSVRFGDVEMILVPFHGEQDEPGAEIDHYTYVFRTDGLTLYGGVDAYRDTAADMDSVLQRVRDDYHPSVAFLPISRMAYRYDYGGVNGFCH